MLLLIGELGDLLIATVVLGHPFILFAVWLALRNRAHAKLTFSLTWALLSAVVVGLVFFSGEGSDEVTRIGGSLLAASTTWLWGPVLIGNTETEVDPTRLALSGLLLIPLSLTGCFWILAANGLISGM